MSGNYVGRNVDVERERGTRSRYRDQSDDGHSTVYVNNTRNSRDTQARPRARYESTLSTITSSRGSVIEGSANFETSVSGQHNRRAPATPQTRKNSTSQAIPPGPELRPEVTQRDASVNTPNHGFGQLSDMSRRFVRIELDDLESCYRFAQQYTSIFSEDYKQLIQAARNAFANDENDLAERCIHRALLISYANQSRNERLKLKYIEDVADDKSNQYLQFWGTFDSLTRVTATEARQGTLQPTRSREPPAAAETIQEVPLTAQPINIPLAGGSRRVSTAQAHSVPVEEIARLQVRDTSQPDQYQPTLVGAESFQNSNIAPNAPRRPSSGTSQWPGSGGYTGHPGGGHAPRASLEGSGTPNRPYVQSGIPDRGSLDQSYWVRNDAREFFSLGRVFKVLWHQAAGTDLSGRTNPSAVNNRSVGMFGEPIYSSIRWMLVVIPRSGYAMCCPISTHGGKGLGARRLDAMEMRAHAIAYATTSQPIQFEDETQLSKTPIPIMVADHRIKVSAASRIHFGKLHTIEYNMKVCEVGEVPASYHKYIRRYVDGEITNSLRGPDLPPN